MKIWWMVAMTRKETRENTIFTSSAICYLKVWLNNKQMTLIDWNLGKINHLTGGPCTSKRLPFRLVAGVWTLAAFIFVQAYTSTLFTYVVTPIKKSLINSIDDIADNSDINLFLKKNGTPDRLITVSSNQNNSVHWPSQQINLKFQYSQNQNNTGLLLKLRERLDSNPNSRCILVSDCIRFIKPGSRNVFMDVKR